MSTYKTSLSIYFFNPQRTTKNFFFSPFDGNVIAASASHSSVLDRQNLFCCPTPSPTPTLKQLVFLRAREQRCSLDLTQVPKPEFCSSHLSIGRFPSFFPARPYRYPDLPTALGSNNAAASVAPSFLFFGLADRYAAGFISFPCLLLHPISVYIFPSLLTFYWIRIHPSNCLSRNGHYH